MEAVRLRPSSDTQNPYSVASPAPASALAHTTDVPIPHPQNPGELLVKIEATTIIRDSLTWPEIYDEEQKIIGWDFSGTIVAVNDASDTPSSFKVGDEVFGMVNASRAGTWAQYAITLEEETCLKPENLTFAQAAAVPLSALTAYQALFEKAGLAVPDLMRHGISQGLKGPHTLTVNGCILVTGAVGGVGLYVIQLAKLLALHVVAATSSNTRNKDFLDGLGADEIIEYKDLARHERRFQIVIDTVGGDVLRECWSLVKDTGTLVSIDSASYDFVEIRRKTGMATGCGRITALFFIVEPSNTHLKKLSAALKAGVIVPFVAAVVPLSDVVTAYNGSSKTSQGRGKVILAPWKQSCK